MGDPGLAIARGPRKLYLIDENKTLHLHLHLHLHLNKTTNTKQHNIVPYRRNRSKSNKTTVPYKLHR